MALIQILRQRIFINHSSTAKTFITEEYTVRSLGNGVDNIFIEKDQFLPNLLIFDSDGEELPIIRNDFTLQLLENKKKTSQDEDEKNKYQEYIDNIKNKKVYMLWIKIPPNKKMIKNQLKIINLEYDAIKDRKPTKKIETVYKRSSLHSVFYIIKKPEDYDFSNKPHISLTDNNDKYSEFFNWNIKPGDPIYVTETYNSLSVTIIPDRTKSVYIAYSFSANKNIISFPLLAVGLLSLASVLLLILNNCSYLNACGFLEIHSARVLFDKKVEFLVGVMAASVVLPGLIRNDFIRNTYKYFFLIPLVIAFIALL